MEEQAPGDEPRPALWPLVVIAAACIATRLHYLGVPMVTDEGSYAYVAKFWSKSHQLYRDIPFDRPQGLFLVFKLGFALIGESLREIRFFAALWNAGTGIALFQLLRAMHSERAAWFGALGFALFSTSVNIEGFTANGETYANLPLVLSAFLAWRGRYGWAGFAAGAAAFLKPSGVSGLLLAIVWALRDRKPRMEVLRSIAAFSLWPLASMVHGILIDWEAYWTVLVRERGAHLSVVGSAVGEQLARLRLRLVDTFPAWALPFACSVIACFRTGKKARDFALLFCVTTIMGMALGGMWFEHYFIQLVLPLCMLGGMGAASLTADWRREWPAWSACAAALGIFLWGEAPYWAMTPTEISQDFYERPSYIYGDEIGAYVRAHTREDESIYVAFSRPQLYFLSQRRAEPPILYGQYLKWAPRNAQLVMDAIAARAPAAVIAATPIPGKFLKEDEFWETLLAGYEKGEQFHRVTVYLRRSDKPAPEAGAANSP